MIVIDTETFLFGQVTLQQPQLSLIPIHAVTASKECYLKRQSYKINFVSQRQNFELNFLINSLDHIKI